MNGSERHVCVKSYAKVNLDLRVLWRREDGYHEIRTLFHTISLADGMEFCWQPGRGFQVETQCPGLGIRMEENLAHRAALLVGEAAKLRGRARIIIKKRIPAGGGLGGGSSNAASVLLALPVLANKTLPAPVLLELAANLGSDVPFFLMGGAAIGMGRGDELYPVADFPPLHGLLAQPGIPVSTAAAYRLLHRPLASQPPENKPFAKLVRDFSAPFLSPASVAAHWNGLHLGRNDFEPAVFREYRELEQWKRRLLKAGAAHAMMSGSGSTVFGLFATRADFEDARLQFEPNVIYAFRLVSRARYQQDWLRRLGPYSHGNLWPPQPPRTAIPSHG